MRGKSKILVVLAVLASLYGCSSESTGDNLAKMFQKAEIECTQKGGTLSSTAEYVKGSWSENVKMSFTCVGYTGSMWDSENKE